MNLHRGCIHQEPLGNMTPCDSCRIAALERERDELRKDVEHANAQEDRHRARVVDLKEAEGERATLVRTLNAENDDLLNRIAELEELNRAWSLEVTRFDGIARKAEARVAELEEFNRDRISWLRVAGPPCMDHSENNAPHVVDGCLACEVESLRQRLLDEHEGSHGVEEARLWESQCHEAEGARDDNLARAKKAEARVAELVAKAEALLRKVKGEEVER